jgi:hypothetical protein
MSDSTSKAGCGCTSSGGASGTPATSIDEVGKVLQARVAQAYDAKFNVRIVPARSLPDLAVQRPGCRPRGHSPGWTGPSVSPGLVSALAQADKAVTGWLARDRANAQRFLGDPVSALREAGVKLERAQLKELVRARAAAETTHRVPPGVTVTEVAAEAFPNGRVGGIGTHKPGGSGGGTDAPFRCGPKRKG